MARVALIRQDTGEAMELDAAPSVDWSRAWAVTAHPVERGAPITDHTQALPAELQVTAIVTGLDVQAAPSPLAGLHGAARFEAFRAWIESAATTLWDVVVPDRPSLTGCLVSALQIGMTMDGFLTVTVAVREVQIVDAATVARITPASQAGGSSGAKVPAGKPPAKTEADLAPEAQDGAQPAGEGGLLYQSAVFLGIL